MKSSSVNPSQNKAPKVELQLNKHVILRVRSDFPLTNDDLCKINLIYTRALKYLFFILDELWLLQAKVSLHSSKNKLSEKVIRRHSFLFQMLQKHFNIPSDISVFILNKYLKTLIDSVERVKEGLYAENSTLYISDISRKKTNVLGHVEPDKDRLYIKLAYLEYDIDKLTEVLIHEAGHYFSGTKDYLTYYDDDPYYVKPVNYLIKLFSHKESLSQMLVEKRLTHADSFSHFVYEASKNSPNFPSENLDTEFRERELIPTDVEKIFTTKKPFFTHYKIEKIFDYALPIAFGALVLESAAILKMNM